MENNLNSNDMLQSMNTSVIDFDSCELNRMNIIINDGDCSDSFFKDVCNKLREDGLNIEDTSNGIGINKNNSVVITLDQQYNSRPSTVIFAPYNNSRVGNSDSLALSMQAAFIQMNFGIDGISCGKIGYREDVNGEVSGFIPTETEDIISEDSDTSFVTISLGTDSIDAELVAKGIENGLARWNFYLANYDSNTDLIYRSNNGEDVQIVADYFGSSTSDLSKFNNLNSDTLEPQTIINPEVKMIEAFDSYKQFNVIGNRFKSY